MCIFAVRAWCFSLHCPIDTRNCFRTGPFGGEGQTFFRDLLELEESLRKRAAGSQADEIDETTTTKQAGNRSDSDDRERESIEPTTTNTCRNVDSDIRLERKVNASSLRDAEAERSIAPRKYVLFSTNYLNGTLEFAKLASPLRAALNYELVCRLAFDIAGGENRGNIVSIREARYFHYSATSDMPSPTYPAL